MSLEWLKKLEIRRISRSQSDFDFIEAFYFSDESVEEILEEIEKDIAEELLDRRRDKRQSPNATNAWLKMTCFNVIAIYLNEEFDWCFRSRIEKFKRLRRGSPVERNIFEIGLVAIFAAHPKILKPIERKRLADAMWYGYRHCIPPALLEGFNHQYPGHSKNDPDWESAIEPELASWVIQQHSLYEENWGNFYRWQGQYNCEINIDINENRNISITNDDDDDDDDGDEYY